MSDLTIKPEHLVPGCPICNTRYEVQRIQILDERDGKILSYFKCEQCRSSFLAVIAETPFGHMAAGLMTDLEAEEVLKFAGTEPLSHDDVLEVHERLEQGRLDF